MGYVALITALIDGIGRTAALIEKLRAAAKQSGELTPEKEAELDAKLAAAFESDAWKPDAA